MVLVSYIEFSNYWVYSVSNQAFIICLELWGLEPHLHIFYYILIILLLLKLRYLAFLLGLFLFYLKCYRQFILYWFAYFTNPLSMRFLIFMALEFRFFFNRICSLKYILYYYHLYQKCFQLFIYYLHNSEYFLVFSFRLIHYLQKNFIVFFWRINFSYLFQYNFYFWQITI